MEAQESEQKVDLKDLPLSKVLELLVTKVQAGRTLPKTLTNPPWKLPHQSHDKSEVINEVLTKSIEMQSSKIPGSDDFENFIISNSCLAVSGLLRY